MPDHAHLVIVPGEGRTVSAVVRIIKGGISRRINALEGRTGKLWQEGFFDKVPRDRDALNEFIRYVEDNPVAASLAPKSEDYEFSSARGQCREEYYAFVEGRMES
jgi:REP element-mobilizing transposase RayT